MLAKVDLVCAFLDECRSEIACALQLPQIFLRIWQDVVRNTGLEVGERTRVFAIERGCKNEFSHQQVRGRSFGNADLQRHPNNVGKRELKKGNAELHPLL